MAKDQSNQGQTNQNDDQNKGTMSVQEAGRKGGEATSATHGREYYEEIGHQGGQRVSELVNEGKEVEDKGASGKSSSTE
jgi:uncharacterized protein